MAKSTKVKVTVKSVISEGIIAGSTVAKILKDVGKKCPTSVADESHVKYYSGLLKREGVITEEQHGKYVVKKATAKTTVKKATVKASAGKDKTTAKKKHVGKKKTRRSTKK